VKGEGQDDSPRSRAIPTMQIRGLAVFHNSSYLPPTLAMEFDFRCNRLIFGLDDNSNADCYYVYRISIDSSLIHAVVLMRSDMASNIQGP
jgi:hypothetical protein